MKMKLILAAMAAMTAMASPAHAVTALKLEITLDTTGLPVSEQFLQVTEIQAFDASNVNVALGGSVLAGAGGNWTGSGLAAVVTDGIINGAFGPNLYHPLDGDGNTSFPYMGPAGQSLTVTFANLTDIKKINVFGRTGSNTNRNQYNYKLFDDNGTLVSSGSTGRAVAVSGQQLASAIPSAIPEPSTWALMIAGFAVIGASLRRRRTSNTGRLALA